MDSSRYATYAPLAAILLFATALQAALLVRLPTVSADGIIFIRIARDLAESPIETFRSQDQHPGYPAMLLACARGVQWLGYRGEPDSWMAGGVVASFICGVLSVAVVWLFARDLFDAKVANVAAIAFTLLPVPRAGAVDAQSDTPHALFYLLAAWMAATGITHGSLWRLGAAGLASGVAYWIRPEGLEVVLVALPLLAWHAWRAHWPWRKASLALGTLATAALLVAAPYPILAGKLTSKQLPGAQQKITRAYQDFASPAAPLPNAAAAPSQTALLVAAAPSPPAAESRYSAKVVGSLIALSLAAFINSICQGFKFVFIPLYLLGNVALVWRRPARIQIALLAILGAAHIAILMGVHVFSGYIAHRHVIPLVGLAMPFVGLGIVQWSLWLAPLFKTRPAYVTAATLAVCSAIVLPYTLRRLNREFLPVIEATRWVQSRAPAGSGIVCNSPYVGFYGTLPVAELGPAAPTLDEALAKAPCKAQYDYVVLHVNAHDYQPRWIDELAHSYRQVLELPDLYSRDKFRKVLVFQAREGRARRRLAEDLGDPHG
ncbi:MAG: glycosyltransferase family 39 protein, partial [Pirellulales bacterium]